MHGVAQAWADKFTVNVEFSTYFLKYDIPKGTGILLPDLMRQRGATEAEVEAYFSETPKNVRNTEL